MSLEISNISKTFSQGEQPIHVLRNLSLSVKTGESIAILGPSGSGKSTFLSLLAGLDRPDQGSGEIRIDGKAFGHLSEKELTHFRAENIGIIFQQFHLVNHLTAFENVALPLQILKRDNIELKTKGLLKYLGLEHRLDHLPLKLSGGESQRVAVARALICQPKLLLADEPTGNLDAETSKKASDLLFQLIKEFNMTTVIVTHSPDLANRCQRRFRLAQGHLEELT